jgi:hypothetical protein
MLGLVSRRRMLAVEAENRRLRNGIRMYERASMDSSHLVYRYEKRLARLCRAIAGARDEAAVQRRVTNRLANQLLDAVGYRGEPFLPAAHDVLGVAGTSVDGTSSLPATETDKEVR